MPTAFSYLRFSSPEQARGDSIRRQNEAREKWLAQHPDVQLDRTLVMTDAGRSAFCRKDWDTYALAQFVECIKSGRVRPGSYLLVENLDRLSREDEGEATELFLSIVNKGIIIVQLSPLATEYRRPVNMISLMHAILELSRGHSESAMKSDRVGKAWANKRKNAAQKVLTRKLPSWVRFVEGKLLLVPEKAQVVRRIFALAGSGLGVMSIAKTLNEEGVPVLGRTTFKGRPVVWSESIVYGILTSRATIGEYQPGKVSGGKRVRVGEPVRGYYPPIIDADEFDAVQALLKTRSKVGRGRRGRHVNLFAGLLRDARTGGSLTAKHLKSRSAALIPVGAKVGRGDPWASYPLVAFEKEVLASLVEVKLEDVQPGEEKGVSKIERLAGRLAELEGLVKKWRAKMDRPELVDVVADKLAELEQERRTVAEKLAEAQQNATAPFAEAWGQFRTAGEALSADNSDETRERCRAAIRRVVESVWVLIMPGRPGWGLRLCAVQVWFKSGAHRDYLILSRPPKANGIARQEGQAWSRSLADVSKLGALDLRKKKDAVALESVLAEVDVNALLVAK
jgi:DNA invertase Pin-like site-specific DNA recombinase